MSKYIIVKQDKTNKNSNKYVVETFYFFTVVTHSLKTVENKKKRIHGSVRSII